MGRPTLVVSILLVGLGVVLGTTVFRDDIARAAGGSAPVTVVNTAAEPVPVTGTVGLGTTGDTHLADIDSQTASIDSQTAKLSFDTSGNLKTAPQRVPAGDGGCWARFDVPAGGVHFFNCPTGLDASLVFVAGADDNVIVEYRNGSVTELALFGSGRDGAAQWQLPLAQSIPVGALLVQCHNALLDCELFVGAAG